MRDISGGRCRSGLVTEDWAGYDALPDAANSAAPTLLSQLSAPLRAYFAPGHSRDMWQASSPFLAEGASGASVAAAIAQIDADLMPIGASIPSRDPAVRSRFSRSWGISTDPKSPQPRRSPSTPPRIYQRLATSRRMRPGRLRRAYSMVRSALSSSKCLVAPEGSPSTTWYYRKSDLRD